MSLFYRPISDVMSAGWSGTPPGSLYPTLNETVRDDTNYTRSIPLTSPQVFEVSLGSSYPVNFITDIVNNIKTFLDDNLTTVSSISTTYPRNATTYPSVTVGESSLNSSRWMGYSSELFIVPVIVEIAIWGQSPWQCAVISQEVINKIRQNFYNTSGFYQQNMFDMKLLSSIAVDETGLAGVFKKVLTYEITSIDTVSPPSYNLSSNHILRYTYGKNIAGGQEVSAIVVLKQGNSEITSFTHSNVGSGFFLAEQTLTVEQIGSITDYNSLRIAMSGTIGFSLPRRSIQCSWMELEIQD